MSNFFLGMQGWPVLGLIYKAAGEAVADRVNADLYDVWMAFQIGLAVTAAAVVVAFRHRLRAWVVDLLIVIVLVEAPMIEYFVSRWLNGVYQSRGLTMPTTALLDLLARSLPFYLLWMLPAVAAVIDLRRNGRRGRTWVEWACFGIAIAYELLVFVRNDIKSFSMGPWRGIADVRNLVAAMPLVAITIDVTIVLRFGPAWRRWLGREARPALASSGDSAMMGSSPRG